MMPLSNSSIIPKGVISRALDNDYLNPEHAEECFDVNVLKTLFMIKYVKEITATVNNITSLMASISMRTGWA